MTVKTGIIRKKKWPDVKDIYKQFIQIQLIFLQAYWKVSFDITEVTEVKCKIEAR